MQELVVSSSWGLTYGGAAVGGSLPCFFARPVSPSPSVVRLARALHYLIRIAGRRFGPAHARTRDLSEQRHHAHLTSPSTSLLGGRVGQLPCFASAFGRADGFRGPGRGGAPPLSRPASGREWPALRGQ